MDWTWKAVGVGLMSGAIILHSHAAGAQVTGSITGGVTDTGGGALAGVLVVLSGERLIGGPQEQVTTETGMYRFDRLPPGSYNLRFELSGFQSVERTDIRVSATFTATVNVQLAIGQLEESITVSGESPVVDTKANVQQTLMGQDILERVPTGRDVWALARIIPGVTVSTYDVGGTQGMQQSGLEAHGSRTDDKTFAIDGLAVNWPGAGGGATMVYYDQGMFEEINYQTSAIPAEVAVGGIFMNMVTKAGGNSWRGDARYYYANENMQSRNFSKVSERFNFPGGNPVTLQYDLNATGAGPVLKDRVWLFGSYRQWKVDKLLLSVFNPDGTNAIDDNLIWNISGKLTAQVSPEHRFGVVYNYNQKDRYHRRDTPPNFVEDKASYIQEQPGWTSQVKYTGVLTSRSVLESTMGAVAGTFPLRYQKDVRPEDIRREDTVLDTACCAAQRFYENPNYRFQFDNVLSHTRLGWGGSHNVKAGVQFTRQFFREINRMNGDMRLIYNNGVPFQVMAFNTPVIATSYVHQIGFFAQDSWGVGRRLTLNLGARADRATGWMPEQVSPAGRWVAERQLARRDVYDQWIGVWRTGVVFDLFGTGRTALKGNVSRYAHQVGIGLVTTVHPFTLDSANIAWTDHNRNNLPDPGELGAFEGFAGAATTRHAGPKGPAWGYSDEFTAGVEHQLIRDLRVGVMYYHRTNRNNTGTRNAAVPSSAYTPVTVPNPLGGSLTIYNLNPAFLGLQDNVREAVDLLDTVYDGIEITAAKRFSNRWQMLFGYTTGRNEGGVSFGDFNDPNNLINQQGIVGNDATHQLRLSGTFLVPRAEVAVSGSLVRNTGYPRQFTYQVTRAVFPGLTRSAQTVRVNTRGDERLPPVTLLDLRLSRPIRLAGNRSFEPQLDIFNVTNTDVIVRIVDAIGPRLGFPTEIMAPRIIRVGFSVNF
jgi:hypothetical protein